MILFLKLWYYYHKKACWDFFLMFYSSFRNLFYNFNVPIKHRCITLLMESTKTFLTWHQTWKPDTICGVKACAFCESAASLGLMKLSQAGMILSSSRWKVTWIRLSDTIKIRSATSLLTGLEWSLWNRSSTLCWRPQTKFHWPIFPIFWMFFVSKATSVLLVNVIPVR